MNRLVRLALMCGCLAASTATLGQPAKDKPKGNDEDCVIWPIYDYGTSTLFYCDFYPGSNCSTPQAEYELLDAGSPYPCDCAYGPLAQDPPDCCRDPAMDGDKGKHAHGFGGLRAYFISGRDFAQQPYAKSVLKHLNSYEEVLSINGMKYVYILARTPNRNVPAMMYRFDFSIQGHAPPAIGHKKTVFIAFEWRGAGGEPVDAMTPLDASNPHAFRGTYTHNGEECPLLVLTR